MQTRAPRAGSAIVVPATTLTQVNHPAPWALASTSDPRPGTSRSFSAASCSRSLSGWDGRPRPSPSLPRSGNQVQSCGAATAGGRSRVRWVRWPEGGLACRGCRGARRDSRTGTQTGCFASVDKKRRGRFSTEGAFQLQPRAKPGENRGADAQALKGRANWRVDRVTPREVESPFQGLRGRGIVFPGRCPGLRLSGPVGAKNRPEAPEAGSPSAALS